MLVTAGDCQLEMQLRGVRGMGVACRGEDEERGEQHGYHSHEVTTALGLVRRSIQPQQGKSDLSLPRLILNSIGQLASRIDLDQSPRSFSRTLAHNA